MYYIQKLALKVSTGFRSFTKLFEFCENLPKNLSLQILSEVNNENIESLQNKFRIRKNFKI